MSSNWEQYFPFKSIRDPQRTAIDFIIDSFQSGKRVVVIQAPVGQGKSAMAMTVANYYSAQSKKSYFLTTQKVLQDQYMRDFESMGLTQLKSASSYVCQKHDNDPKRLTCLDVKRLTRSRSELKQAYKECQCNCRYSAAKEAFFNASKSITNYAYFLATNAHSCQKMPARDLLILDEGHNIESAVTSFVQVSFSNHFYKKTLNVKMPSVSADQAAVYKWLTTTCRKKLRQLIADLSAVEILDKESVAAIEAAEQLEDLEKNLKKLEYFRSVYDQSSWVLDVSKTDRRGERIYEFKPIHVGRYVRDLLLNYADNVLVLSATIIDKDMFCEANGISLDEVAYLELPSTFPVENRLMHCLSVGSMSRKHIETTLPNIVEVVKALLEQHANEKGIIHCGTFKIAQHIHEKICSDRLLIHDSSNRNEVLLQHIRSPDPTVLLSPSMTEGVDLIDDLSRFQIICKVPYPYLGDIIVQKRMELNEKWYPFQTAKTMMQALGRSVRTERDHATSYMLDSDWNFFYKKNRALFPIDFDSTLRY